MGKLKTPVQITVPTIDGESVVEYRYVYGDFAVTPSFDIQGNNDGGWVITHLPSGRFIGLGRDHNDGGTWVWCSEVDAAIFARRLAGRCRPGDIYQDEAGNWRSTPEIEQAYLTVRDNWNRW